MAEESGDNWHRLELLTDDADSVGSILWESGALGLEVQDHETYMEDGSIAPVPEGKTRVIAFFDGREAGKHAISALSDSADVEVVAFARFDDRDWETAWKDYFEPVRLSRRVIVGPPWEEFDAPENGHRLVIEPGMAFGTGTHETTHLCAEIIDELLDSRPGASLFDVGTGSAILAMLASRLGAGPVVGIDVDETAVEVARANLEVNGCSHTVDLSTTPLSDVTGAYDIVVANILAHILLDLRADLVAHTGAATDLVVSGVTSEQDDDFIAEFAGESLHVVERRQLGEWVGYRLRRR